MATLILNKIGFEGRHGASAAERRTSRRFEVDVEIEAIVGGETSDRLADTIDFRFIAETVVGIGTGEPHRLIRVGCPADGYRAGDKSARGADSPGVEEAFAAVLRREPGVFGGAGHPPAVASTVNVDVDVDGVADVNGHGHDAERVAVAGHGAVAENDFVHVGDVVSRRN